MNKNAQTTIWILTLIFLPIFLLFINAFGENDADINSGFICGVVKVKDGDTFKCASGISIRLWGVNTPELKSKDPKEKERAYKAKLELENTILHDVLYCIPKGASYNRVVAQCYTLNDFGKYMIETGLADEVPVYSKNYYKDVIKLNFKEIRK